MAKFVTARDQRNPSDPTIKDFVTLLEWVASVQPESINWLLEASIDAVREVQSVHGISELDGHRRTTLIVTLLKPTLSTLATHNVEPTPAIRKSFEFVLRSPLFEHPVRPKELPGWAHRPRGCGWRDVCPELDKFLASETETEWSISAGKKNTYYLYYQLNRIEYDVKISQHPRFTILVRKLQRDIDNDLVEYNEKMAKMRSCVSSLKGEYLQKLFGEDMYRELVLLDNEEGGTSRDGAKRTADDEVTEEGEAKRLKT